MQHDLTIICDDIRQEVGRKVSLIGIYDEAVIVAKVPARLAKLCVYQRWIGTDQPRSFRLEVKGPSITTTFIAVGQRDDEHYNPAVTRAQLTVVFSPFDILTSGECQFITYLDDNNAPSHVHHFEVRLDPNLKMS
jgi:hypothetical protein